MARRRDAEVPALSRWLLSVLVRRDAVADVLGDLEERHRRLRGAAGLKAARRWYRRQALQLLVRPTLLKRPRLPVMVQPVRDVSMDVRIGVRSLRKQPVSTAAIVLTLALGTGAVTAVFSALDQYFLRAPAGIADPGRLVEVYRMPEL